LNAKQLKKRLVAHRGYRQRYPENTLLALEQAVAAGVNRLEFDIQLTADRVPVLFHDLTLKRTCGVTGTITECTFEQLSGVCAGEVARLGDAYKAEKIPSLADVVAWASRQPKLVLYAEIKEESLQQFGYRTVIEQVLPVVAPLQGRLVLMSFDSELIARLKGIWPDTGLVLRRWPPSSDLIRQCDPCVVFVNKRRVGFRAQLHHLGIPVVVYEIDTVRRGRHWLKRGATYLETFSCGSLAERWSDRYD